MTSVDHWIAGLGQGGGIAIALLTALLLGLRHATDPDHLTAVSTLALAEDGHGARRAGRLGLAWGLGHATTLLVFGVPALLLRRFLPAPVQHGAEVLIGIVIVALAVRLLVRWRRGYLHTHPHRHGDRWHAHPHVHVAAREHARAHVHVAAGEHAHALVEHSHRHGERIGRSPLTAYAIGLIHGMGGSAAVTLLLVAAIPDRLEATGALIIFALATAASMGMLSAGFGSAIASRALARRLDSAVPLLGLCSLAFGVFYALSG